MNRRGGVGGGIEKPNLVDNTPRGTRKTRNRILLSDSLSLSHNVRIPHQYKRAAVTSEDFSQII